MLYSFLFVDTYHVSLGVPLQGNVYVSVTLHRNADMQN